MTIQSSGPDRGPARPPAWPIRESALAHYAKIAQRKSRNEFQASVLRLGTSIGQHVYAYALSSGQLDLEGVIDRIHDLSRRLDDDPEELDSTLLVDLARVLALQNQSPQDLQHAYAILNRVVDECAAGALTSVHEALHLQLAIALKDYDRARELLESHTKINEQLTQTITMDLLNPFSVVPYSQEVYQSWHSHFSTLIAGPAPTLTDDTSLSPFDRLTGHAEDTAEGPLVTVIVTAYRPPPTLKTSIRSLVAQSWVNLEIIIVDDASPPEYHNLLHECEVMDPRITLLRLDENVGTYAAKNRGITLARGEFIGFHDADDWCHPHRIRDQVLPLLQRTDLVATQTNGQRVSDTLLATNLGRPSIVPCASSLVIRADAVRTELGFFDRVRKAADSEYIARIGAIYGEGSLLHIGGPSYTVIQAVPHSLSRSDFQGGWRHPVRSSYRFAYQEWHARIARGTASGYVPEFPETRPFSAPLEIRSDRPSDNGAARFDVVYVGDWSEKGRIRRAMLEEVEALAAAGLNCGVINLESLEQPVRGHPSWWAPLTRSVNQGRISVITPDSNVVAGLVVARQAHSLQARPHLTYRMRAQRTIIIADRQASGAPGRDANVDVDYCTATALELFGVLPTWAAQSTELLQELAKHLPAHLVESHTAPWSLSSRARPTDRSHYRSDRPVVGYMAPDSPQYWPRDRATLRAVLPADTGEFDVRIRGGSASLQRLVGSPETPSDWVRYEESEVTPREFLSQIDFLVAYPSAPDADLTNIVEQAVGAGAVVILPPELEHKYARAALYFDAPSVKSAVRRLRSKRAAYTQQRTTAASALTEMGRHSVLAWMTSHLPAQVPVDDSLETGE